MSSEIEKDFMHHGHDHSCCGTGSFLQEILYHLPYAVFSVAFCFLVVSFFSYTTIGSKDIKGIEKGADILFHSFHFMHILFSVIGSLVTYFRFSNRLLRGFFVGMFSAMVFCTLSDAVMPYIAGRILGVRMDFHLCFFNELDKIVPFLIGGLVTGVIIGRYHKKSEVFYSVFSHFLHILVSSFASMFYLIANGFSDWYTQIGFVFIFLVIAVVVPCVMSDIVTPMVFAKVEKKNARNKNM